MNTIFKMQKGQDIVTVEILEDGTVKTTTDKVSAPNHANIESVLRDIDKLTGGKVAVVRRSPTSIKQTQSRNLEAGQ